MYGLAEFPLGGDYICVETYCLFSIILGFMRGESSD